MPNLLPKSVLYRPDIDGLRAIAVLTVVLFHADISIFSGGFVGVDIFFVISGFLITRLLIAEIDKTGHIDFGKFYLRRIRRLLPAFIFTVISSSVFAIWILSPQDLENYGATLIHSVLSISNVYFYTQSGYFDIASKLNPLLHTWTLGVEEQFYFVWPILLFLAAPKKWIAPLLASLIGLISLYLAQRWIQNHTSAVFYLMPFRIFEFSIGAVLVWLLRIPLKSKIYKEPLLLLGLALITYSVFGYSDQTLFPGVNALVPCLGAALCIYAGDARISGRILSNRLFVGIGLMSYSLYLAHWPVIVFYKQHIGGAELTRVETIMVVVASSVIAMFMYFYIEKPFRKGRATNGYFLFSCAIFSLLISYMGASMWATDGWNWRSWASSGAISMESVKKGKEFRFHVNLKRCETKGWDLCDEPIKGRINALILGDSHAIDALNAFEKIYPTHNFSMSQLGSCPPYRDIEKITKPGHLNRMECKALNEIRFDPKYLEQFDYIVINLFFSWYTPEHLREYLEFLNENKIQKVIVLGDYLTLKQSMYELLNEYGYRRSEIKKWVANSSVDEAALKSTVNREGYFFLSKREAFCQGNNCELFDNHQIPFTYDEHHLSYEFAARIALKERNSIERYLGLPLSGFYGNAGNKTEEHQTLPSVNPVSAEFSVGNWGPQSTREGVIPNVQVDGHMGLWIEITRAQTPGDLEVIFDGHPAAITVVSEKLITAGILPKYLAKAENKTIQIKQKSTNKLFLVGEFVVQK